MCPVATKLILFSGEDLLREWATASRDGEKASSETGQGSYQDTVPAHGWVGWQDLLH